MTPAAPEYGLGEVVRYVDRQQRPQRGEVLAVEASWRWGNGTPLVIYELRHPSYRNNRCYATIDAIIGRAALSQSPDNGAPRHE